jgi:DNA-binding transcriptional LysR family regulator
VDAVFGRAGLTRRIAFELSTSEAVVRYVALGFGAAVVPESATKGTEVAVLTLSDSSARHPVSLIHRHPEPSAPSARAFIAPLIDATASDTVPGAGSSAEDVAE